MWASTKPSGLAVWTTRTVLQAPPRGRKSRTPYCTAAWLAGRSRPQIVTADPCLATGSQIGIRKVCSEGFGVPLRSTRPV